MMMMMMMMIGGDGAKRHLCFFLATRARCILSLMSSMLIPVGARILGVAICSLTVGSV